jgi:pimeloyl-ACP methyl ester carboxylesterase
VRTTTRLLTVASFATVLVLSLSAAGAAAPVAGAVPAAPHAASAAALTWTPCPEDATAECATLAVPVDWAQPRGASVNLALARRRATDPAARIGSLLINPGGPGGSGVDFALFADRYFSSEITRRFDVVGFDPRGVARSHPVICSLDLLLAGPSPVLTSQADFDAVVGYNRRLGADCRQRTGPLFDHVDTLSVVHDVDAIRAALGESKISYYGISYGTLIGQEYAETFPDRIRALVIDANMDHSLGTRAFLDTEAATVQDSFDEFVAGCGRLAACALHGRDVKALWASLLARADAGQLRDPAIPVRVLSAFDVIATVFGFFYAPDWLGLADYLVALDTGPGPAAAGGPAAASEEPQVVENPFQAVFCEDWSLPVRDYADFARQLRRQSDIAPDVRYSPLALSATVACLGWPAAVNNPQHRLRVADAPTLFMANALHDPATAYAWAADAARQLNRSAILVTYEGWGHGVYGRGPCPTGAMDAYLTALALPDRGTRCPAVEPAAPGAAAATSATRIAPAGPRPAIPGWF